jgi:hypothetical protein
VTPQLHSQDDSGLELPVGLPVVVSELLHSYADVFTTKVVFPPPISCSHTIPLIPGARPVNIRPYRYAPVLKSEIEKQVHDMLEAGLIQPSSSPFSSPVLLVKKKDKSYRFCVDYRHLNAITLKGQYPVPIIDEFLDELNGASWFSSLDLCAGFHQIPTCEEDCYKTAFQTHHGHYEFKVMSFGLTSAPHSFQKAMNSTLQPLLRKCALVFLDDILVYSQSLADHVGHLQQVLQLLRQDHWQVKLSKCAFAVRQIAYLGYIISDQGVSTCPDKVKAVQSWPTPSSVKELRSFLDLARYYRKFVRHFGVIARPLTELLKKNSLFVWTLDHDTTFQTLKSVLTQAPVLALPDFSKSFCIETDASDVGVGAVLM